jgi:hypothetical protein
MLVSNRTEEYILSLIFEDKDSLNLDPDSDSASGSFRSLMWIRIQIVHQKSKKIATKQNSNFLLSQVGLPGSAHGPGSTYSIKTGFTTLFSLNLQLNSTKSKKQIYAPARLSNNCFKKGVVD